MQKVFGDFDPLRLDPYLFFDAATSMVGTLENPTLDLDPATPSTLDVITATRAGIATYTDPDGNIATASADTVRVDYTQGAELTPTKFQNIGQTEFDQWTSENATITANVVDSPFGNQDASKLVATSTSQRQGITIVTSASDSLVASVYAKKGEYDVLQITDARNGSYFVNFDLTNGAVGSFGGVIGEIQNIGNGWFRCISKFTSSLALIRLRLSIAQSSTQARLVNFAGNGTDGLYIYGPQLEEGTTASSFVENTTGSPKFITGATYGPRVPMILVEPSATNLLPYSEDFSNAGWSKYGSVVVTPAFADSPDGTTSGSKIIGIEGTDGDGGLSELVSASASTTYTFSAYFKASSDSDVGKKVRIRMKRNGGAIVVASQQVTLSSEWVRHSVTMTTLSDNTGVWCTFTKEVSLPIEDRADECLLWGAQVETGSVATSYIPVLSGSPVTRAADDLVISGSDFSDFYNQSEGTFYCEFQTKDANTAYYILNSQSEQARFFYSNNNTNTINSFDGTTATALTGLQDNTLCRVALSIKASEFKASKDGSSEAVAAHNGNILTVPTELRIGKSPYSSLSLNLNGHIKRVIYWPYHSDSL